MPYRVDLDTGIIDYDTLQKNAILYRPKVLVAGTSAYCRLIDYERMRKILLPLLGLAGLVAYLGLIQLGARTTAEDMAIAAEAAPIADGEPGSADALY